MVSLTCQKCGAALHWDGSNPVVLCAYCGTEYLMHPQKERFQKKTANPYIGHGTVQGIPIVQGTDFSGLCPIESYVPNGWRVQCSQASDEYYGDQASNPYVVQADFCAPDNSAYIIFRGSNTYTDRKLSRIPLMKQIDVLGSFMRIGSPFNAEQYCDYLLRRDVQPVSGRKAQVEQADSAELERQNTIRNNYLAQGFTSLVSDWKRTTYMVVDRGQKQKVVSIETRVNDGQKGMMLSGGGMFGQLMGQMFSNTQRFWETQYEFIVIADADKYDQVFQTAQKINESIQYTPDFEKMRQILIQYIQQLQNQTAMAINQQNMVSWDRKSSIIQDTHNYTMGVMHEMNANTVATHQRVANLHSESIRGVNTYYTTSPGYGRPDVVEADVRWDHVYQNGVNPDIFAATENYWLEPGVDFEELKKTGGNY